MFHCNQVQGKGNNRHFPNNSRNHPMTPNLPTYAYFLGQEIFNTSIPSQSSNENNRGVTKLLQKVRTNLCLCNLFQMMFGQCLDTAWTVSTPYNYSVFITHSFCDVLICQIWPSTKDSTICITTVY